MIGFLKKKVRRLRHWLQGRGTYMIPATLHQYPPQPIRLTSSRRRRIWPKSPPCIALVTPSYNQAAFLEETIQSILGQDYPRLRYAITDGGSTDGSAEIIRRHQNRLDYWHSRPDAGQADAIIAGFQKIDGEIMGWLNADDLLSPDSLQIVSHYFMRHPEIDVLYGDRILINRDGDEIGRWILPAHDPADLPIVDVIPQETCFWRSSVWHKVGGVDRSFQFALDWDLLLRFRTAGAKFQHIPEFLGCFRVHDQQKTSAIMDTVGEEESTRLHDRELGRKPLREEIDRTVRNIRRRAIWRAQLYRLGLRA